MIHNYDMIYDNLNLKTGLRVSHNMESFSDTFGLFKFLNL